VYFSTLVSLCPAPRSLSSNTKINSIAIYRSHLEVVELSFI
jgi:hypothetical protein